MDGDNMKKLIAYLNRIFNPENKKAGCDHKWGTVKQWVVNGEVVNAPRCKDCGKIKED
jgi:hypothetical protein